MPATRIEPKTYCMGSRDQDHPTMVASRFSCQDIDDSNSNNKIINRLLMFCYFFDINLNFSKIKYLNARGGEVGDKGVWYGLGINTIAAFRINPFGDADSGSRRRRGPSQVLLYGSALTTCEACM